MILTVTLNAALDVTYRVSALVLGGTHRVAEVAERAGGKGVNVARVLRTLDAPVVATGLAGGACGTRIRSLLTAEGVRESFVPIAAESRRTLVVAEPDAATGLWEPGPMVTPDEWAAFLGRFADLVGGAEVVVLSGSLPPGVPLDAYGTLIGAARDANARTVLDSSGEPLRHGLNACPDLIKPNAEELAGLVGHALGGPAAAADAVRALEARAVVASFGPEGLLARTEQGSWHAFLPYPVAGNPTGAGDACVAALAHGMLHRQPWPEQLAEAVALSAAAVRAPVAGSVDLSDYRRLRRAVTLKEL
ncbi:1-phosphofructokinase family hexose kinase [Micromonospora sp. DR5-3]|uniref:1-phosphofructokinase family hexose kinase n=1 Tax=unclassified Micromonospora TaxID=2617518 RepID=UPI0011D882E7|nr:MULTISPECIES: 1-phosphofructokinase family hexose kinase [unclassified Micromonospora]MCW3814334.1 1-phosphofructokinase family hexose kinase [Micromonospora sp. DR5-3]TYC23366.1 1-phosphofructokinase family hexose kinase [Micromonospora sp. MP36]